MPSAPYRSFARLILSAKYTPVASTKPRTTTPKNSAPGITTGQGRPARGSSAIASRAAPIVTRATSSHSTTDAAMLPCRRWLAR